MLKRSIVVCACVLVASTAGADTLVTWQAEGTVTRRTERLVAPFPGFPVAPPLGAPLSVTLTFDPSSAVPTPFGSTVPLPGCKKVSVSGSVTIGSYTAPLNTSSSGYTQSWLPDTSPCIEGVTQTQFELFVPGAPDDNPFKLPGGILFLSYHDLFVTDAFPNSPTPRFSVDATYYDFNLRQVFGSNVTLAAVQQPTPVPEPGTMTLFGLGLAAAYRRRRRAGHGGQD